MVEGGAVYKIKDNFFKFWFRYVFPNKNTLELGDMSTVVENVKEDFNMYMGLVYQEVLNRLLGALTSPLNNSRLEDSGEKVLK